MPTPSLKTLILPLLLALHGGNVLAADRAADAPACVADLEDAAKFIEANDAGASALLADHGAAIARAFDKARLDAAQAQDDASCLPVLRTYLRAWRPGHLNVRPASKDAGVGGGTAKPGNPAGDALAPQFKVLSKDTILFTLPTFSDRYAALVRKLLAEQRGVLESHPNWIIDVRNNGGGSDSTYAPLMGWLMDGEVPHHGVEYFVTPANIKAQEEICGMLAEPAECTQSLAPVLQSMRKAAPGSYVLKGGRRMVFEPVELEPKRPARVAVLIDHDCVSSCEQFVLEARTGFRVKLVGRPTYGALDDSNLRPHPLPSGRVLYYATTRTTRVPDMRIDGIGIPPDILLPRPKDAAGREAEVSQVQRWLEGGSLGGK